MATADRSQRPRLLGQQTRGKTAPHRLRKTDTFLGLAYPELVRSMPGLYVDLGYGDYPVTSVETLHRLRRLNPALRVVGVEIDPGRVAEAQPCAEAGLDFRLGGFNLPLQPGESVSVIRAFNVLRQYSESDVAAALAALAVPLTEGGLILEGTSDALGRLLAFNVYQKRASPDAAPLERSAKGSPAAKGVASDGEMPAQRMAFVLAPALRADFAPPQFRAVLPKNFIHHAEPGGAIDRFFAAWHAAWQWSRARAAEPRQVFAQAALRLADHYGYGIDRRPALLRRAFLCLGPEWPERRRADP